MQRTHSQNRQMHSLLAKAGLDLDAKAELALQVSNARTARTSELSREEAEAIISHLRQRLGQSPASAGESKSQQANRLRRKVLSIAHQLGWYKRDEATKLLKLNQESKPLLDFDRIDRFCTNTGKYHKPFIQHSNAELQTLIYQFQAVLENTLNVNKNTHEKGQD